MSVEKLLSLKGKSALVGGSTSGIGKAIAIKFAEAGAKVILIARNEDKLKVVLHELEGEGHSYLVADFSNPDNVKDAITTYLDNNDPIDILVNNTGGPPGGPVVDAEVEEFMKALNMHLVCNQILVKSLVPGMKVNGGGRIINIISTSVKQPITNLGVSNTTRGAVANWAKTLANEIGVDNITVNNILPGFIRTPRFESIVESRASNAGISKEAQEENFRSTVPLRKIGEPEDIANGALFLASNAGSYVSGTNLIVDGGRTKTY